MSKRTHNIIKKIALSTYRLMFIEEFANENIAYNHKC